MRTEELLLKDFEYFTTEEKTEQEGFENIRMQLQDYRYLEKLTKDLSHEYLKKHSQWLLKPCKVKVLGYSRYLAYFPMTKDGKATIEGDVKEGERLFRPYLTIDHGRLDGYCDCIEYHRHGTCRHLIALARVLCRD